MKRDYVVVGKLSELKVEDLVIQKDNKFAIDKKKLKIAITTSLSLLIMTAFQDIGFAAELSNGTEVMKKPTQIAALFDFVAWLIELLRLILSSIAGLICTFAGWKWATAIESNGQESAKKILRNAFVGGLIVWTGTSIADFFVDKMNEILLRGGTL